MTVHRNVAPDTDPVCAMAVEPEQARVKGLTLTCGDREYVLCGKGCFLDLRDDPEAFLSPGYVPSM